MPDRQRPSPTTPRDQRASRPNRAGATVITTREVYLPKACARAPSAVTTTTTLLSSVGVAAMMASTHLLLERALALHPSMTKLVYLEMEKMLGKEHVRTIHWATTPLHPEPKEISARREEAEVVHGFNFVALPP
ncbi:hypothetical protein PR003_g26359 [Phytophthora rubi]|uniref:Uncharacterized protein n=1 Tax=Phytophthora rubi TaxID=129364 RepID=A0A6A3HZ48_9STRA|nr:hypothetical protein PR002_g25469 [Phytophthora rubi]KAE9022246.1 hypothetical protein PR001_g13186 [Phytophthora rubi]KAE9286285.1 hypothetical protein PR003_g26359 [Phytophthora rubi]